MADTAVGHAEDRARALYADHAGAVRAYARRKLDGDADLAEDIVQETMVRAWRSRDRLDVTRARPWLFTTARRLIIDHLRARRARPVELPTDDLAHLAAVDEIDKALDAAIITDALAALSEAHRSVLIESYYQGRTVAQIAAAHDLPAGTVRSRLYYALRALRIALQERGVLG